MKKTYIKLVALTITTIPLVANALQNDTTLAQPQNNSAYSTGEELGNAINNYQNTIQRYYKKTSQSVKSMASETQAALKDKAQQSSMYMNQVSNKIKNEFSKTSEAVINSSNNAKDSIMNKADQASKSIDETTQDTQNSIDNFKKGFDNGKNKESKPAPF